MARNTLSFFSRLFSAKKKSILEKKDKKELSNVSEVNKEQDQNSSYKILRNDKDKKPNTIIIADEEDIETGQNNTLAYTEKNLENELYASGNQSGHLLQNYADSQNVSSATTEYVGREISEQIEISSESNRRHPLSHEHYATGDNDTDSDISKDDELEHDSMILLSKLEQLMIKISDSTVQKSIPLVIESLVDMANFVVEFAEQMPNSEQKKMSLIRLFSRDEQNYKMLNSTYIDNERLVVEIQSVVSSSDPKQLFIDLSNDILRLINVYLSASVKAFRSNHVSEQWKTLYTGFFVNLTKSVRSSQSNQ
jgi:hypothetical protein